MSPIELDISPLERAADRLDEALAARADDPSNGLLVDATIQRFEFTYELSHKMLKRYLAMVSPDPQSVDEMSFADLVRTGNQRGMLLSGWAEWRAFRAARGITSHTYDEAKARRVLEIVPDFVREARHLLSELRSRAQPPEAP